MTRETNEPDAVAWTRRPVTIDHPVNHRRAMTGEMHRDDNAPHWRDDPANGWVCRICGCVTRSWAQADHHTALVHPERFR